MKHLTWIKHFPNIIYTNDTGFYKKYIMNYDEKSILSLKNEIEKNYNIQLTFTEDFFKFPKFIDKSKYNDIIYDEICPVFKKVIIKNCKSLNILCMNEKGEVSFKPENIIKNNSNYSFVWYITIFEKEITFYINQFYLGFDSEEIKIVKDPYMKTWNFEIRANYYIIYHLNKSYILTEKENEVIIEKEHEKNYNQLFSFVEKDDYI